MHTTYKIITNALYDKGMITTKNDCYGGLNKCLYGLKNHMKLKLE